MIEGSFTEDLLSLLTSDKVSKTSLSEMLKHIETIPEEDRADSLRAAVIAGLSPMLLFGGNKVINAFAVRAIHDYVDWDSVIEFLTTQKKEAKR